MNHDARLAAMLYSRPNASDMIGNLPGLGESLHACAVDLARDCTLQRIDEMLARLKGAETSLVFLRRSLAEVERD